MAITRGRLSSFDTMPPEAEPILAWAAQEMAARTRTQTDIYAEFVLQCERLMSDSRGELEFKVPAFASFHRHGVRLARLTRRLDQTRQIVAQIAESFDAKESDDLTIMLGETIKSLTLHLLAEGDENMDPKDVMQLATAFKQATQAMGVSTDRRRRLEAEFAAKVDRAVGEVAKVAGMTAETVELVKARILGVGA